MDFPIFVPKSNNLETLVPSFMGSKTLSNTNRSRLRVVNLPSKAGTQGRKNSNTLSTAMKFLIIRVNYYSEFFSKEQYKYITNGFHIEARYEKTMISGITHRWSASKDLTEYNGELGSFCRISRSFLVVTNRDRTSLFSKDLSALLNSSPAEKYKIWHVFTTRNPVLTETLHNQNHL